jgi:phenylalanyl-tRNA synthetase beta chain
LHLELKKKETPFYIPGRAAEIIVNDKTVGHIGEIAPQVLKNFEYTMPVVSFELDLTDL